MAARDSRHDRVVVRGGEGQAAVLNGVYEQIGLFCGRPHYSKDGAPWKNAREGFRENMQIWWHDGEWRIGNTGGTMLLTPNLDYQLMEHWSPSLAELLKIQWRVHGIAGLSMGQLKGQ